MSGGEACSGRRGCGGWWRNARRRLDRVVAGLPCHWLAFLPPSPRPRSQSALPRREGGDFLFSYARGFAPCIPATEPGRHWFDFKKPILFGVAGERRLQSIKIREKFLGVWGLLSRSPQRFSYTSAGAKNPVQYLQGSGKVVYYRGNGTVPDREKR